MSYPVYRHKNRKREYPSGSQKAKLNAEKDQKIAKEIQTTRKVTDFFIAPPPRPILPVPVPAQDVDDTYSSESSSDDGDGHISSSSSSTGSEAAADRPITDIGLWPLHPTQSMVDYWAKRGSEDLKKQHRAI